MCSVIIFDHVNYTRRHTHYATHTHTYPSQTFTVTAFQESPKNATTDADKTWQQSVRGSTSTRNERCLPGSPSRAATAGTKGDKYISGLSIVL
jgi:hypothetical protein